MTKLIVLLTILYCLLLTGCELANQPDGTTYNYPCVYQATKLADESNQTVQRMVDMGCTGIIPSDALYVKCKELEADNKKIIRDWKELPCTNDSKAPIV